MFSSIAAPDTVFVDGETLNFSRFTAFAQKLHSESIEKES
jgi:hypothetical protein